MHYYEMLIKRSRQAPEPPEPSIPTDYVFYAPFDNNLDDVARGVTMTAKGAAASSIAYGVVDGVQCTYLPHQAYACTYDVTGINTGTDPITMSVWVKMADTSTCDGAIFNYGKNIYGSSAWLELGRQKSSNRWFASIPTTGDLFSTVSSASGWHHLVLQWDGQYVYLYVDGAYDGSKNYSGKSITGQWIAFGVNQDSVDQWNYQDYYVAAARIYNRILTADEITALAGEFTPVNN